MWSGWLQLTQAPVQATLQQAPSVQNPESQSPGSSQVVPAERLAPQAAPEQQTPSWQTLVVQSVAQLHACPGARLGASAARQPAPGASTLSAAVPAGASGPATPVPPLPPVPVPRTCGTSFVLQASPVASARTRTAAKRTQPE